MRLAWLYYLRDLNFLANKNDDPVW